MADQEVICVGMVMSGVVRGWGTRWLLSVSGSDGSAAMYSLETLSYSCSADLLNFLSGMDIFGKLASVCG